MPERLSTTSENAAVISPADSQGLWSAIRESLRGSHRDYTSGPIGRAIIVLAIPMVLEMCMESIFVLVDIKWVSYLGEDAMATVGITESLMTLVYALAIGLSIGATATIARRIGEKNPEGAARAAVQAIALAFMISAVIALIGAPLAPKLLSLMGAAPAVIAQGSGFTRVMLAGNATVVMLFMINAVFRAFSFFKSEGRVEGYLSKSLLSLNWVGFTKMLHTVTSHCFMLAFINETCPRCKAPMVGTKPMILPCFFSSFKKDFNFSIRLNTSIKKMF